MTSALGGEGVSDQRNGGGMNLILTKGRWSNIPKMWLTSFMDRPSVDLSKFHTVIQSPMQGGSVFIFTIFADIIHGWVFTTFFHRIHFDFI